METTTSMTQEMESLKVRLKATWEAGDYGIFADYLLPGALEFFSRLNIPSGSKLLDVGCGAGQLTVPAADSGVDVTGIDLAQNLVDQANEKLKSKGFQPTVHQGDAEKIAKVIEINRYHVQQFAYLVKKFKATPDGDGTLLDHVMVTYGSGLSDGNAHDHANLPIVLAGRGCGTLKPGRYVRHPNETPMANLFVALLDRMGVAVEKFGDGNGQLGYLSL